MSSCAQPYSELRPAYTGVASYVAIITICGTGSIAGWAFSASLVGASGTQSATAVVADATARTVTLTLPGQTVAGNPEWVCRRTDDGSNEVVAYGVIEITDPLA